MYKVFANNKPLYFTTTLEGVKLNANIITVRHENDDMTISAVKSFEWNKKAHEMYVVMDEVADFYSGDTTPLNMPKLIAAGGLAKNKKGQYLFIFRGGRWDLPKGVKEEHENIRDAAKREAEEETGVKMLNFIQELTVTRHIYRANSKYILKETQWFKFETDYDGILYPQESEAIFKAEWFNISEIKSLVIPTTYKTILEVLKSDNELSELFR